ncbi:MAG: hypothetical protein NDJ89_13025 [Oligoflexia bacterium]|nr:hypothetical protein [Oligoflexia bacterium]
MEIAPLTVKALEMLFPPEKGGLRIERRATEEFPIWLKSAADIFTMEFEKAELKLTLIQPKTYLTFDQLQNVYRQVARVTGPGTMLVADEVNPKHRPLLVKFRIPFIYRNETVFAPELAAIVKNMRSLEPRIPALEAPVRNELRPFSLKLLAGYLTNNLDRQFRLKPLHAHLAQLDGGPSTAKLSLTLNELAHFELLRAEGGGPHKVFIFEDKQRVWEAMRALRFAPFMRTVEVHFVPDEQNCIMAGESALAQYSNLADPQVWTWATTLAKFAKMTEANHPPYVDGKAFVELWRENPEVFGSSRMMNPIELYFSMRENQDERIQLALKEMLAKLELAVP